MKGRVPGIGQVVNGRILRMELRRSTAPWAGLLVLLVALAFLYGLSGPWWKGSELWTAQWTSAARWERFLLAFLWPLATGAGALQGLRDHRSGMRELLATAPRPAWQRTAKVAGASALTLTVAYLLVFLVGAVQVIAGDGYFHLAWLPILAVGVLGLVAGAWLGMGIGRTAPSALTPPVLAVASLLAMVSLTVTMDQGAGGVVPNRVALLSPALPEVNDVFVTVAGRVSLGQAFWLLGVAATGFLLLAAAERRTRLLALLPLALGAAVALPVLPSDPARAFVVDTAAAAPVCSGQVCVTEVNRARLGTLVGPGRDALRLLAKLPGAPGSVRETTGAWPPRTQGSRRAGVVPVDFDEAGFRGDLTGADLTRSLLAGAGTPPCEGEEYESRSRYVRELAARDVAAAWFLGDLRPHLLRSSSMRAEIDALARPAWNALRALPAEEQRARVAALRAAALSCDGDLLNVLKGGTR
ncbi:hypothetical protein [Streptomyces coeruleorubidus]|uniref:hypothetical protein n=1 Tax=Streptomyces coeruleorubidus TaxID=116188 RepID=UPI0036559D4F